MLVSVANLAVAALLVRHWPREGARHEVALAPADGLGLAGWVEDDVSQSLQAVATVADDEEARDRIKSAEYMTKRLEQGLAAMVGPRWLGS